MANESQDIEFTKGGIKFSYLRFLSDSAPGYFAIFILIYLYYFGICGVPIKEILYHHNILFIQSGNIPNEIILFVLFLLFLLATPLGLIINATSWVFLGWLQIRSEEFWVETIESENHTLNKIINLPHIILIESTKNKFLFEECREFYNLNKMNWYFKSKLFEELLRIYYPDVLKSQDHVDGVRNLLRNIIFLVLLFIFIHLLLVEIGIIINILLISLIILIILIGILSSVSFYYDLCVLFNGYLLHQRINSYYIPKIIDLDKLAKREKIPTKKENKSTEWILF